MSKIQITDEPLDIEKAYVEVHLVSEGLSDTDNEELTDAAARAIAGLAPSGYRSLWLLAQGEAVEYDLIVLDITEWGRARKWPTEIEVLMTWALNYDFPVIKRAH
jgi:hypothetical protein